MDPENQLDPLGQLHLCNLLALLLLAHLSDLLHQCYLLDLYHLLRQEYLAYHNLDYQEHQLLLLHPDDL